MNRGKTAAMSFSAAFDITSFGLGFAVAPVAYLLLGTAAYGAFCASKWLTAPFRRWKHISMRARKTVLRLAI